jgi:hypothetical protein
MSFTVEFVDGPVAGERLQLERAPELLRAVVGMDGKVDALDQLGDSPALGEEIHVYRRHSATQRAMHMQVTPRRNSYWLGAASYRHVDVDPVLLQLDDTETWRAWATAHAAEHQPQEV